MLGPLLSRLTFAASGKRAATLLDRWRHVPLTFAPGTQPAEGSWYHDRYEVLLAPDGTARLYRRAVELLLHYEVYPPAVMRAEADFTREQRKAQQGDRIIQYIPLLALGQLPLLQLATMVEVYEASGGEERSCLGYVTTAEHLTVGQWRACVERQPSGSLVLNIESISRMDSRLPFPLRWVGRQIQLRAHRLGIQTFRRRLFGESERRSSRLFWLLVLGLMLTAWWRRRHSRLVASYSHALREGEETHP